MTEPSEGARPGLTGAAPPRAPLISFPLKVLTAATLLLASVLAVGLVLPGRWEVERSVTVAAPAAAVFPLLDDPRRWDDWAPLGSVQASFSGPQRGAGAVRRWDDPEVGDGVFTILSTVPDREVSYRVEVQKGKMQTEGTLRLDPAGPSTRVVWHERGDFGHNPLLGYIARTMDRTQGAQMEAALARLAALVAARG